LILCEQVIVDHHTRNPSPIGIFTGRTVDGFPSPPQRFSAFAALINGRADGRVSLQASRMDTGDVIWERRYPIRFPDPLIPVNVHIRVRTNQFPVPGRYEFVLYVDSDPIAQRTIRVYQGSEDDPLVEDQP